MTRAAKIPSDGIIPPHFMVGDVRIDFSPADKHQNSPHFHMGKFFFDARSAGESYGYPRVIDVMKNWLDTQLRMVAAH